MTTIAGENEASLDAGKGGALVSPGTPRVRRPTSLRHQWGLADRRLHETIRTCAKCGLLKITHHEGEYHWMEYATPDSQATAIKMPVCHA